MAFFTQLLLASLTFWICFVIAHGDQGSCISLDKALECGLIYFLNGTLKMNNMIPTEKIKNAKAHGEIIEKLDMDYIFEQFYWQISAESGEESRGPDQFQIIIKTLDKKPMTMWVNKETTVKSIKMEIRKRNRGPNIKQQRLMFRGKELKDLQTMIECGIIGGGGVTPMLHLLLRLRGGGFAHYYLNPAYFDPQFDRDFRNEKADDSFVYYRGGRVYRRPYGSMRYAIKVLNKYPDNEWLGKGQILPSKNEKKRKAEEFLAGSADGQKALGQNANSHKILGQNEDGKKVPGQNADVQEIVEQNDEDRKLLMRQNADGQEIVKQGANDSHKEWPVAYHGTSDSNAMGIVREGFRVDLGQLQMYGKGIYTTPHPETALEFAKAYNYNGKEYKLIIQTRVDPDQLKVVLKATEDYPTEEVWLLPDGDAIRPYGICVYEVGAVDPQVVNPKVW